MSHHRHLVVAAVVVADDVVLMTGILISPDFSTVVEKITTFVMVLFLLEFRLVPDVLIT